MTLHRDQDSRAFHLDSTLLACLDVHYRDNRATAACCLFETWESERSRDYLCDPPGEVAPYEPGAFYKRELPCLLAVLQMMPVRPRVLIVDGYAWLGGGKPGLGAHLHEALGGSIAVVGVAKTGFRDISHANLVLRGRSGKPLYVTTAGMDPAEAARGLAAMHGVDRIPTLLRRVDRLARIGTPRGP